MLFLSFQVVGYQKLVLMPSNRNKLDLFLRVRLNQFNSELLPPEDVTPYQQVFTIVTLPSLNHEQKMWVYLVYAGDFDFLGQLSQYFVRMVLKKLILLQKMLNKLQMMHVPVKGSDLHEFIKFLFWSRKNYLHFLYKFFIWPRHQRALRPTRKRSYVP